MLPHQDVGFREGSASRSRGDVDDDSSEAYGIVVPDGGFIGEGNPVVELLWRWRPKRDSIERASGRCSGG